ncbi:MAG: M20/M25/M40 family metallo-hydrolase [Synergistaceae bacterium]|nr:M20/M25/M40 family metallo-hydrolase [Synergistaceae bacterium]
MKNLETTRRLWALTDRKRDELLGICADLIKIPSEKMGQMEAIVEFVHAYLADAGISHEILRGPDDVPCIVARLGREGGKVGVINGHNDIVPVGDLSRWDYSPYCGTITDRHILGRGASDMKCGVGMALFLAKTIVRENLNLNGKLVLHIVHDEESGGEKGTLWLTENGYADGVDFCLVPEPTTWNNVEVGQKGSMRIEATARGGEEGSGDNAVHKMTRFLARLSALSELEGTYRADQLRVLADSKRIIRECLAAEGVERAIDHVNVNLMALDGASPRLCRALVGALTPVGLSVESVKDRIEEIARECAGITVEYPRRKDAACTDPSSELAASAVENATLVWGRTVVPAWQWATSDAKFYRYKGIPTIQYGPANTPGIHAYNENVDIEDVINCAKTYFGVLEDLMGFEDFVS